MDRQNTAAAGQQLLYEARANDAFRRVLETRAGDRQYVAMAIDAARDGADVGPESHAEEQHLYTVDGEGTLVLGEPGVERLPLVPGSVYKIPPRLWHTIHVPRSLRLLSVYFPPAHRPGLVQTSSGDPDEPYIIDLDEG